MKNRYADIFERWVFFKLASFVASATLVDRLTPERNSPTFQRADVLNSYLQILQETRNGVIDVIVSDKGSNYVIRILEVPNLQ